MRGNKLVRAIALAVIVVVAGGCGGESTEAGAGDDVQSPLAEYMGFANDGIDFTDEEATQEYFANEQRRINEVLVECMAAEGFDYVPEDTDSMIVFGQSADSEGLVWGTDEWVAKYGFGISTQSFPQEMVGPELIGMDESMFGDEEDHVDPNQEYLEGLSEAERQAYEEVLYGGGMGPEITEGMSDDEIEAAIQEWEETHEPTGCYEIAQADSSVFGGQNDFYREFGDELDDLYQNIQSHPKLVAAERETAECVADKGLTYSTMEAVYDDFDQRLEPLYEMAYSESAFEVSEEEAAAMSPEELEKAFATPAMSDEAKATLAEIQADEIELAVAVNECGGGFDANVDIYQEVSAEIEQQFIDENKERLDEFKAAQSSE